MIEVLTIGEPMALFVADQEGALEDVRHFTKYVSGAEVNFAVGMARLNHEVAYITKLGQDPFGKYIKKFLAENKINNSYVNFDAVHKTGFQLKGKVTSGDPEVVSFRTNSAAANLNTEDISNISWETIKHLHLTGIPPALSVSSRAAIYEIIAAARKNNVSISFDPNLRPALWNNRDEMIEVINDLAGKCDIVLPGINEGKILVGSDDVDEIADFYLKFGVKTVVIKLGAKGAYVKTQENAFTIPAFKVEKVVDTVGAGDGFAVGVISGLLEGLTLQQAVVRGNAIGALAVMSPGDNDGLPTRELLIRYLNGNKV